MIKQRNLQKKLIFEDSGYLEKGGRILLLGSDWLKEEDCTVHYDEIYSAIDLIFVLSAWQL